MVARPCLNIVWSSASKTLICLVGSGALSIPYHYTFRIPLLSGIATTGISYALLAGGGACSRPAFFLPIHPSAWKKNSRKSNHDPA